MLSSQPSRCGHLTAPRNDSLPRSARSMRTAGAGERRRLNSRILPAGARRSPDVTEVLPPRVEITSYGTGRQAAQVQDPPRADHAGRRSTPLSSETDTGTRRPLNRQRSQRQKGTRRTHRSDSDTRPMGSQIVVHSYLRSESRALLASRATFSVRRAERAVGHGHRDKGPRDCRDVLVRETQLQHRGGRYRCQCGHALRVFGTGRHRVYFQCADARLDDPMMNGGCPGCECVLPGKRRW